MVSPRFLYIRRHYEFYLMPPCDIPIQIGGAFRAHIPCDHPVVTPAVAQLAEDWEFDYESAFREREQRLR